MAAQGVNGQMRNCLRALPLSEASPNLNLCGSAKPQNLERGTGSVWHICRLAELCGAKPLAFAWLGLWELPDSCITSPMTLDFRTMLLAVALFGALLLPSGCSVLPSGASTSSELLSQGGAGTGAGAAQVGYELIDIDASVALVSGAPVDDSFAGRFGGQGSPVAAVVGVGDVLAVSVFESALGGLFTPPETSVSAGAKNVVLPQVSVDADGYIRIPYAEKVKAAGRTTRQIEVAIEARLRGRAIDPQVVVTLAANRSALVTVSGDVRNPSRFPVGIANERLLDVLAQAGGALAPPHESVVKLVRGKQSGTISLKTLFEDPRENVYVRPFDIVLVQKAPRAIVVLGASARNAELRFDADRMTLAAAIGQAGGLQDLRADPAGVFIFRLEPASLLARLRPGWSDPQGRRTIPVIYRLDLRVAGGFFLAQSFQMRNQDLIFVANADATQLLKMLQLVGTVTGAVYSTSVAAASLK